MISEKEFLKILDHMKKQVKENEIDHIEFVKGTYTFGETFEFKIEYKDLTFEDE